MNKRIKELAEQATVKGHWSVDEGRYLINHVNQEKFAELIIAECAKACEPAAQPEQEPLTEWLVCPKCSYKSPYTLIKAATLAEDAERITKQTRAALAQPEPEPVGHLYTIAGTQHCTIERVLPDGPLYTSPPRKEWAGLTDEQKNEMTWGKDVYEILELAEAKLKELNHE
jgi:hypothetical protein